MSAFQDINPFSGHSDDEALMFPGLLVGAVIVLLTVFLISAVLAKGSASLPFNLDPLLVDRALATAVVLGCTLLALGWGAWRGRPLRDMLAGKRVSSRIWLAFLPFQVGMCLVVFATHLTLAARFGHGSPAETALGTHSQNPASSGQIVVNQLLLFLVIPFLTEVLVHGFLLRAFLRRYPRFLAILASALAFSLLAPYPAFLPETLLIGLLYGWAFGRIDSILPLATGAILLNLSLLSAAPLSRLGSGPLPPGLQTYVWVGLFLLLLGAWGLVRLTRDTVAEYEDGGKPLLYQTLPPGATLIVLAGLILLGTRLFNQALHPSTAPARAAAPSPEAANPTSGDSAYREGLEAFEHQQYPEALARFTLAGENGVARGYYRAGTLLADGLGVPRDLTRAAFCFGRALELASGDLPEAAWRLAALYQTGKGAPKDEALARQLRQFALDLDLDHLDPESLEFLAGLWEDGSAGSQNLGLASLLYDRIGKTEKADLLIVRGVGAGDPESLYLQGLCLIGDRERAAFPADAAQGEAALRKAADLGHEAAAYRLSKLLASRQPQGSGDAEALKYLQLASGGPHPYPAAEYEWGNRLLSSNGGTPSAGVALLEKAAASGYQQALPALAQWYASASGDPANLLKAADAEVRDGHFTKAKTLLLKAVDEKVPGATLQLAHLYLKQHNTGAALDVLKEAVNQGDHGARALQGAIQFGAFGPEGTDFRGAVLTLLQGAREGDYAEAAQLARQTLAQPNAPYKLLDSQQTTLLGAIARGTQAHDPDATLAQASLWLGEPSAPHLTEALKVLDDAITRPAGYPDAREAAHALAQAADLLIQDGTRFQDPDLAKRYAERSAAGEDSQGWLVLARIYESGLGVTKDPARASYCRCRSMRIQSGRDPRAIRDWWAQEASLQKGPEDESYEGD